MRKQDIFIWSVIGGVFFGSLTHIGSDTSNKDKLELTELIDYNQLRIEQTKHLIENPYLYEKKYQNDMFIVLGRVDDLEIFKKDNRNQYKVFDRKSGCVYVVVEEIITVYNKRDETN